MGGAQAELFAPAALPEGLVYQPEWLDVDEEAALLAVIATLPLQAARYKGYTARRRVASYGTRYDFDADELQRGAPPPAAFEPLRLKAAGWIGVAPEAFDNLLVAEYRPGTALGWHRDVPDFGRVVGVSLGSACRMRLRRWPPRPRERAIDLELAPRSAYRLQGEARWRWQHSIAPTPSLRYSITLRTAHPR